MVGELTWWKEPGCKIPAGIPPKSDAIPKWIIWSCSLYFHSSNTYKNIEGTPRLDLHVFIQPDDKETNVSINDARWETSDETFEIADLLIIYAERVQIKLVPIAWFSAAVNKFTLSHTHSRIPRTLPLTICVQFRITFDRRSLFGAIVDAIRGELIRRREINNAQRSTILGKRRFRSYSFLTRSFLTNKMPYDDRQRIFSQTFWM